MANLDYTIVVRELQPLAGKFFEKFYELGEGKFRLKFGRDNILVELPLRLHKTKYLEESPEPSNFSMKVRKELKGKRLSSLSQHGNDRVIIFDFEGTQLIAEMFGKGNLILLREGKILAVYSREKWKGRELLSKAEYKFPPSETKSLQELLSSGSKTAVAAELRALDIGMSYVRALLEDAGVPDSKPIGELSAQEKQAIEKSYSSLMESPSSFSIFTKGKEFPTLSEALDEYYGIPESGKEEAAAKNKELEKLQSLLHSQEEKIGEFMKEEEDARKNAEYIYSHYDEVESILSLYKKEGLEGVEKLAKKKGWKLDKKEKILEIEEEK